MHDQVNEDPPIPDDPLTRAIHAWLDPERFRAEDSTARNTPTDGLGAADFQRWKNLIDESTHGSRGERPATAPPRVDRLGPYRIVAVIGSGGLGHVFRAIDERDGRTVAVKILRDEVLARPRDRERFEREAAAARRVSHPSCVRLLDTGNQGPTPYAVFELIDGLGLDEHLRILAATGRRMPPARALEIGAALADALGAIHAEGLVHRDVKPSNVRLASDGRIVLVDFGLAAGAELATVTRTGEFAGSLPYAPPEQIRAGVRDVDARADVYALGATIYECLTGKPVFTGASFEQVVLSVVNDDPLPASRLEPGLPRSVDVVLAKALAKHPAQRYRDVHSFAEDLRALVSSRPIRARPEGTVRRLLRIARRNPGATSAIVIAAVAILALPTALFVQQKIANREIAAESQRRIDERDRAEANLLQALEVIHSLVENASVDALRTLPGSESIQRSIMESARGWYQTLLSSNPSNPNVKLAFSHACRYLANLCINLGDPASAESAFRLALSQQESVRSALGDSSELLIDMADSLDGIASSEEQRGDFDGSKKDVDRAIEFLRVVLAREPRNGRACRARASLLDRVATRQIASGDLEAAEATLREAIELQSAVVERTADPFDIRGLSLLQNNLGGLLLRNSRPADAVQFYELALDGLRKAIGGPSHVPEAEHLIGGALLNLTAVYRQLQRDSDARKSLDEGLQLLEKFLAANPGDVLYTDQLGKALCQRAMANSRDSRKEEAAANADRAVELLESLVKNEPRSPQYRIGAANAHAVAANIAFQWRDDAKASDEYAKALANIDQALESAPHHADWIAMRDQVKKLSQRTH